MVAIDITPSDSTVEEVRNRVGFSKELPAEVSYYTQLSLRLKGAVTDSALMEFSNLSKRASMRSGRASIVSKPASMLSRRVFIPAILRLMLSSARAILSPSWMAGRSST